MSKRLGIAIALLVLFSTYKPQKIFLSEKFNIQEINIENNYILNDEEIKNDLSSIYNTNLFFLNTDIIKKILIQKNFVHSFKIKKIYPNTLKIKIFEKKPIAILQYKKNKFFYTERGNLINYQNLKKYENLPVVFGAKDNFEKLYNDFKKINFSIHQIKFFYYFKSNRWDLLTLKDQLVKLPIENYILSLENFIDLQNKKNFDKYKIFDYRINNQLILK